MNFGTKNFLNLEIQKNTRDYGKDTWNLEVNMDIVLLDFYLVKIQTSDASGHAGIRYL